MKIKKSIEQLMEEYIVYVGANGLSVLFRDWLKESTGYNDEQDIRERNNHYSGIEILIKEIKQEFWKFCKENNIYGIMA